MNAIMKIKSQIEDYRKKYNKEDIWFRGEAGIYKKMVPSMYRTVVKGYEEDQINKISLPEGKIILSYEKWMYENINKISTHSHRNEDREEVYSTTEIDDWDTVYFEQHYGMPTRFLDWSNELNTGLFFATQNPKKDKEARLWLIDPLMLNDLIRNERELKQPNTGEYIRFMNLPFRIAKNQPPVALSVKASRSVKRIHLQHGVFIFVGLDKIDFKSYVADLCTRKDVEIDEILHEIRIEGSDCLEIKNYLDEIGVHEEAFGLNEPNYLVEELSFERFLRIHGSL